MRHRNLLIATTIGALAVAGCGGDEDPGTAQTEPEPTVTDTATVTETETETVTETETGTGTETEPPTETGSSAGSPSEGDVAALSFATCETDDYTIGYPQDWNTNDPDGAVDACRVFHPGEIDLEPQQDMDLHYAASVYVDAVAYEDARDAEPGGELLEERELTVGGRDAIYREVRSDGRALTPEGETSATYIVDLDGEILVATTYTVGETDYERDKAVLERMVTEELSLSTG